jgi:hypothetical protein
VCVCVCVCVCFSPQPIRCWKTGLGTMVVRCRFVNYNGERECVCDSPHSVAQKAVLGRQAPSRCSVSMAQPSMLLADARAASPRSVPRQNSEIKYVLSHSKTPAHHTRRGISAIKPPQSPVPTTTTTTNTTHHYHHSQTHCRAQAGSVAGVPARYLPLSLPRNVLHSSSAVR